MTIYYKKPILFYLPKIKYKKYKNILIEYSSERFRT